MDAVRRAPGGFAAPAAGALATFLAAMWVTRVSGDTAVVTLVAPVVLAGIMMAFAVWPHIAIAALIPFFVFTPALKLFVDQRIGVVKDLVVAAAAIAAVAVYLHRRGRRLAHPLDTVAVILATFLGLLYVLNVGGHVTGQSVYDGAWLHGTRLRLEPLLLFLAALVLGSPRKNLRWAAMSIIVTACVVSIYGVAQQVLGEARLAELGYSYGEELRTIEGRMRSFGTLDSPFTYAAFLVLALGMAMFTPLRRSTKVLALGIISVGLVTSLVRTAAVIAVALFALWLVRRGSRRGAAVVAAVAVVAGLAVFASLDSRTTRTVQASPTLYLTLNGRTTIWEERLAGKEEAWLVGEGVGTSGTAATRAERGLLADDEKEPGGGSVVDSGYFVTILDVGLVGLGLSLLLLGRLSLVAKAAAARGDDVGWVAAAVLIATLFTALTAEAFTDFPYAYLAMLMLGLACAASLADATATDEIHRPSVRARA